MRRSIELWLLGEEPGDPIAFALLNFGDESKQLCEVIELEKPRSWWKRQALIWVVW